MKKINGFVIDDYDGFAYDGCHKIYLYKYYDAKEFKDLGYTLYPFEMLIDTYINSCSLRFIDAYDSREKGVDKYIRVIRQFEKKVDFEGFNKYNGDGGNDFEIYAYEYNNNVYWQDYKLVIEHK